MSLLQLQCSLASVGMHREDMHEHPALSVDAAKWALQQLAIEAKKLRCNYPKLWVFWRTNFMHGGVLIPAVNFEPFASVCIRSNVASDFYCKTWCCLTNWQNFGEKKGQMYQHFSLALDQGIFFQSFIKS